MNTVRKLLSRFRADARGSMALIMAATTPVVIGFGALAVDIGFAYSTKTDLQQAADFASLATLQKIREDRETIVFGVDLYEVESASQDYAQFVVDAFNANAPSLSNGLAVRASDIQFGSWDFENETFDTDPKASPANAVRITATMSEERGNPLPTFFGRIFKDSMDVSVETTAVFPVPPSFHVLSEDAVGALTMTNRADNDTAWTYVNSSAEGAAHVDGSIGSGTIYVAGTATGRSASRTTTGYPALEDFLQDVPEPAIPGCSRRNYVASGFIVVLRPGHYCEGLTIRDAEWVVFQPGTYTISDGPLLIDASMADKQIFGLDVLIHMHGADANLVVQGGRLSIGARESGDQAGIAFFSARGTDAPTKHVLNATFNINGILYSPDTPVETGSRGHWYGNCRMVCLVADTLTANGTFFNYFASFRGFPKGDVYGNYFSSTSTPFPPNPPALIAKMQPYTIEID